MKNYKDFEEVYIGSSYDMAALVLVGGKEDKDFVTEPLCFSSQSAYYAYLVEDENVQIDSCCTLVTTFKSWLKIYDDDELVYDETASEFRIYRTANDNEIILQVIGRVDADSL